MSDNDDDEDERAARAGERQQERRSQLRTDLAWVMGTVQGRRFVQRLLDKCGVDQPVFNPNGSTMTHAEGRRSVGIELLIDLKANAKDEWLQMIHESISPITKV